MSNQTIPEAKTDEALPEFSWDIRLNDLLDVDYILDWATINNAYQYINGQWKYGISIDGAPVHAYTEAELHQLAEWVIPLMSSAA